MKISSIACFRLQLLCLAVLGFFTAPVMSRAEMPSVGLYYGRGLGETDFNQYDLHVALPLHWQKSFSSQWVIHSDIEAIVSVLEHEETAFKPSLMVNMIFSSPGNKVDIIAGLGAGFMIGDTLFKDDESYHDLGGPFFMQGQVGIRLYLTDHIFAGCRYFHQSNAGIYEQNDSLNLGQFEIGWRF